MAGFLVFASVIFYMLFPDMFSAMRLRFDRAALVEGSLWNRVWSGLSGWTKTLMTAPLLGYGIGAGAPGVSKFLGLQSLIYGEGDLQRNLNELGLLFGVIFLMLRWFTAAWVLRLAFTLARRGWFITLPLAGFVAHPLAIGQITHSPLNAFLPWLTIGIIMKINYIATRERRGEK